MAVVVERCTDEPLTATMWRRNRLLAALPEGREQQQLADELQLVVLALRTCCMR
jgi:hypothetical protein